MSYSAVKLSAAMETKPARGPLLSGWMTIAIFWLFLFLIGYPMAFIDDLYFIGAALNLAHGGPLVNPYSQETWYSGGPGPFFAYMPLHSYVLACWLKVFGLSRYTLTSFQCVMGAISSAGLWRLLRTQSHDLFLPLASSLAVAAFLSSLGLRADALGVALLAWGAILLISDSYLAWSVSSFCLALILITNPSLVIVIPLLC